MKDLQRAALARLSGAVQRVSLVDLVTSEVNDVVLGMERPTELGGT